MPSITSTSTTSPSSFSTAYWATVAPTLPAPTTVIFGRAITCRPSGSSPCWPSELLSPRGVRRRAGPEPGVPSREATNERVAAHLVDLNALHSNAPSRRGQERGRFLLLLRENVIPLTAT